MTAHVPLEGRRKQFFKGCSVMVRSLLMLDQTDQILLKSQKDRLGAPHFESSAPSTGSDIGSQLNK